MQFTVLSISLVLHKKHNVISKAYLAFSESYFTITRIQHEHFSLYPFLQQTLLLDAILRSLANNHFHNSNFSITLHFPTHYKPVAVRDHLS